MTETIIDFGNGWRFTKNDLIAGYDTHNQERGFLGISNPVDVDQLFPVFTFSMLSAAQNTTTLVNIFDMLKRRNLLNHKAYFSNKEKVAKILKKTHYPNQKIERFKRLCEWWQSSSNQTILEQITSECNSGKSTVELRNKFVLQSPFGINLKTSSFILQLITEDPVNVQTVVIDKWVCQFLKDIVSNNIIVDNYNRIRGPNKIQYLEFEQILTKMSQKINLSPSQFGLMIWCKVAKSEPNRCLLNYMEE